LLTDADGIAGVRLATGAEIATRRVAVVAGPWSPALLAPLGVDLPVHAIREQILVLDPGRETRGVPVLSDLVSLQYLRAESGGRLLVGNSDLSTPEPADPDRYVNHADGAFLERMGEKVSHRFPGLPGATVAATYAGCYDVTPDFNPVIGATGVEGLSVAAGFSGHGFTLAPAVGELVADLVLDGDAAHAAGFRLGRFAEGDLLRSAHRHASAGDNPVSGAEPAATASAPARAAGDRP
jgi:glycine/D-amino acid oxidase-like deaminating enzyme